MDQLQSLALFAAIVIVLVAASWRLARPGQALDEATALGVGLGLGLFAALAFVIGLVRLDFRIVLVVWAAAMLLLMRGSSGRVGRSGSAAAAALSRLRGFDVVLAGYLLAIGLFTLVPALAPPNGGDYDSLVYHLTTPQQYLHAGRIVELAYDHHSYFPQGTELLYALGLWLHGAVLAKLFHWLMLPLCALALIAMGRRHFSLRIGLLAAVLFVSLPVVQAEASTAYIDLALTAYSLLAFLCFFNWVRRGERGWLVGTATFCGFCLATKYLGALTYLWLLGAAVLLMWRRRRFDSVGLAALAALTLLIGGGWYLRNALWVGNPVFPFAFGLFGGQGWTAEMARLYTRDQMDYGFGRTAVDYLMLPWRLSMTPLNIAFSGNGAIAGGQGFWPFSAAITPGGLGRFETAGMLLQSVLGPVLLAFGAPLVLMRRKPLVVNGLLVTFAFFFVFWAVTGQYLRYLLPAFALLCLACAWGVARYLRRSAILRWTTALSLAVWLAFAPLFCLSACRAALPVVLGHESEDAYLSRTFGGYDAMHWAALNSPAAARFAVFGEPRCFYLERSFFLADDMHNNWLNYHAINSGAALVSALRRLGATDILWNSAPLGNGGAGNAPPFIAQAVAAGTVQLVYDAHGYGVYHIVAPQQSGRAGDAN